MWTEEPGIEIEKEFERWKEFAEADRDESEEAARTSYKAKKREANRRYEERHRDERNAKRRTGPAPKCWNQNAKKTHCPKGHPYRGANLIVWSGRRRCRECYTARRTAITSGATKRPGKKKRK